MSQQIYYVTLRVADNGRHPFGTIQDGQMQLSEAGQLTAVQWQQLTAQADAVQLDAFVVMPNHLHGLVMLGHRPLAIGTGFMGRGFGQAAVQPADTALNKEAANQTQIRQLIDSFVQESILVLSKIDINKNFWHKPYEIQLVQSEKKLNALRHAIYKNPTNWLKDRYYSPTTNI